MANYLWAIPLLPLLGAILNGYGALSGKLSRGATHVIACSVVLVSFLVAGFAFFELMSQSAHGEHGAVPQLVSSGFTWIQAGDFKVDAALLVDPLSSMMILIITGIGFLIHLYSTGYMSHEPSYARYFSYLNLFTFSMLILVMGENMVMMFVGWEGVGVCSYLLIGFWFGEVANADAGKKAFIVNRVGDFGFILGIFLLYWTLRGTGIEASLSFPALREAVTTHPLSVGVATSVCLLLFVGATGKSAQIPLYIWLPDAMAGPTPVSALIHAATMVTAGVYMITRLNFIFVLSPVAMTTIAVVGASTALLAATIGITQNDIKKVLAYSTVSQLGYMFLGVGLGAFSAGMFHLLTHAFFKACLFLGSGSVIHAMGGEQDMRKMGGLSKKLPYTFATFLVATLAIAGLIGTSGFVSKDEILAKALAADSHLTLVPGVALYATGFVGALITTFYMSRLVFMTFFGSFRGDEHTRHHLHESPWTMVGPLVVLAVLSAFGGFLNWPRLLGGSETVHHWIAGVVQHEPSWSEISHGQELLLMVVLQLLVVAAGAMAYYLYVRRPELPDRFAKAVGGALYRLSLNKYYVDEIYQGLIVRPVHGFAQRFLWPIIDVKVIDGAVNGIAWIIQSMSRGFGRMQSGQLNTYAFSVVLGMVMILAYYAIR